MALFNSFSQRSPKKSINEYAQIEKQTKGAQLFDVRTPQEFAQGHIPGAKNVELAHIDQLPKLVPDTQTPLFLYCRSGRRSGMAADFMRQNGYTNVTNMGGIIDWNGPIEK